MAKSDWRNAEWRERACATILKRANWDVREYVAGDEVEILRLCQQLFDSNVTPAEWQWRMFMNPAGPAISRVAVLKETGRIVGHLAALPIELKVADSCRKIFFLVDSVVEPAYQGRGIHAVLTMQISKIASTQWAALLTGLPNTQAYGPNLKLGGTQILTMSVYLKVLNWAGVIRARLHANLLARSADLLAKALRRATSRTTTGSFVIEEVQRFDEKLDELWKRISPRFTVCANRTSKLLNWRYFDRPDSSYSVFSISADDKWVGYIVVRLLERWGLRLGTIVDLFVDPDCAGAGKFLVQCAEKHLRSNRANVLWGLFACPRACTKILRQGGLFKAPQMRGLRQFHFVADFVSVDHSRPDLYQRDGALLRDGNQWLLSLGDTDLA